MSILLWIISSTLSHSHSLTSFMFSAPIAVTHSISLSALSRKGSSCSFVSIPEERQTVRFVGCKESQLGLTYWRIHLSIPIDMWARYDSSKEDTECPLHTPAHGLRRRARAAQVRPLPAVPRWLRGTSDRRGTPRTGMERRGVCIDIKRFFDSKTTLDRKASC